jgi:hypothetical protein
MPWSLYRVNRDTVTYKKWDISENVTWSIVANGKMQVLASLSFHI